jgi:hypothetical protein
MEDYLVEDNEIKEQTHCCLSIVTPETVKAKRDFKKRCYKFRGTYPSLRDGSDRAKFLGAKDNGFHVYCLEVGKWIGWCDNPTKNKDRDYVNRELNEMIKQYYMEFEERRQAYEDRKSKLAAGEEVEKDNFDEEDEEDDVNVLVGIDETLSKNKVNKLTTLKKSKELKSIPDKQLYFCVSVITPNSLKNSEKKYDVRGIKFRGAYATEEKALERVKYLKEVDDRFNVYVGNVCDWYDWTDDPNNAKEEHYMQDKVENMMTTHARKQKEASMFHDFKKNQKVMQQLNKRKEEDKKDTMINKKDVKKKGAVLNDKKLSIMQKNKELKQMKKEVQSIDNKLEYYKNLLENAKKKN